MAIPRRSFLKGALPLFTVISGCSGIRKDTPRSENVKKARKMTIMDTSLFTQPVKLASLDLYENNGQYIVKAVSTDGAQGIALSNPAVMKSTYPILLKKVIPYFLGKDVRELENLIRGVYLSNSNYKWQGLPFWVCVASAELAILDLLGNIAGKPVGQLLGGIVRDRTAVYRASGRRGNTPEEEVEDLKDFVDRYKFQAVKFKLGGRMYYDEETTRRDRGLVPLARKVLGDITIYTDANGSYDSSMAVSIGRMLEENNVAFFEEPCPFDAYEDTRTVCDRLTIPIAGGEQEGSMGMFQWMIENRVVDVVQPDLFYFGGLIRSVRVARMAQAAGMSCIPHMSGGGMGILYVLHFASCVPNTGPHQEYKGETEDIPFDCPTATLKSEAGVMHIPSGSGMGISLAPDYLRKARKVTA